VIYFWIQFMTKLYRSLTLAAVIAYHGNSVEAAVTSQALGIPRYNADAKSGRGILGVEFGSPTAAASIKAAPVAVSLKLADDGSDEITVSHSEESRAHLQDGEIAGIATTDKGIAMRQSAGDFLSTRNAGPGIGAIAQDRSRTTALPLRVVSPDAPVEFIHVINDVPSPQIASLVPSLFV
jgi:hypothetical protein